MAENVNKNNVSVYLKEMEKLCPYINPAKISNRITNKGIYIPEKDKLSIERRIFWESVEGVEEFRKNRQELDNHGKLLLNTNIFFTFEHGILNNILDWPHFLLKLLYTKVGIVFGKFHVGAKKRNELEGGLPSPPYTHLAIRSALKKKDSRFFSKAPYLLNNMLENEDNGMDVFIPLTKYRIKIDQLTNVEKDQIYIKLHEIAENILFSNQNK
ncbi:hypothetical protein ACQJ0Y_14510 [Peribacillus simplex]|uniref:hypothetical protein n=1 Tax=Peribacillus simplex TaxID=1478 RepID=UPI003CF2BBB8